MVQNENRGVFETTNWSLIERLRSADPEVQRTVGQELASRYWPPVYTWMRCKGLKIAEAEDATQAFFADVVLQRGLFQRADPQKASLRQLILRALQNFSIDQLRRRTTRERVVQISAEALEVEEQILRTSQSGFQEAFEERWARGLLQTALHRCRAYYQERATRHYWSAFEAYVLWPAVSNNDPRPQAELAEELGFKDAATVAVAIQSVKVRCRAMLEQALAETDGHEDIASNRQTLSRLLMD